MRWAVLAAVLLVPAVAAGAGSARTADATPQVYLVDVPSGSMTWLTEGSEPSFSPDGRWVVYLCRGAICTIEVDGSDRRTLTAPCGCIDRPVWSPDGRKIAFSTPEGVSVIGADGSGLEQIARGASSPSWSPDSRRLVFEAGLEANDFPTSLRTARVDGKPLRKIATGAGVWEPMWSPSGHWIAYSRGVYNASFGVENRRLWLVNVATGRRRTLGWGHDPVWDPRRNRLAFRRGWNGGIYVASVADARPRQIAPSGLWPVWSPNGRKIAYWRRKELVISSPSGKDKRVVTRFTNLEEGPGSRPSWSADGKTLATAGTP